jgi:hypothetical protein
MTAGFAMNRTERTYPTHLPLWRGKLARRASPWALLWEGILDLGFKISNQG